MIRVTLWHIPEDFGFRIRDLGCCECIGADGSEHELKYRFYSSESMVAVAVISEFDLIPITVEFSREGVEPVDPAEWDRIVECPLKASSGALIFESSYGDQFGRLDLPKGGYRLRILYGGQDTRDISGSSSDCYLIQIWPSQDMSCRIIKPTGEG